jgi:hypothetical protein
VASAPSWAQVVRAVCCDARSPGEDGFITLFVVIMSLAMLLGVGLLGQGAEVLVAKARLASVAQQAALAGADTAVPGLSGQPMLDPAAATSTADAVLNADRVAGTATVSGLEVQVSTHDTIATPMLAMVGHPRVSLVVDSGVSASGGV